MFLKAPDQLMRTLPTLTSLLAGIFLIGSLSMPASAQSLSLESMPLATQNEISRICLPVQYREGAPAYRNCVLSELALRDGKADSAMGRLSFDDKYAVQQACATAGGQSSQNYQRCVAEQIVELNTVAAPNLAAAAEDELYAIQQTCFSAQSKEGAANYRRCLNSELDSLLAVPAADTSALNMLNKNALQLRCSANTTRAADYRKCIAAEFESIAGRVPTFLPVSTATRVASNSVAQAGASAVAKAVESVAKQSESVAETSQALSTETIAQADTESSRPVQALPRNITPNSTNTDSIQPTETLALSAEQADDQPVSTLRDPTGNTPIVAVKTNTTVEAGADRVISRPTLVKALEEKAQAKAQGIEPEEPNAQADTQSTAGDPVADATAYLKSMWSSLLAFLSSLDRTGWMIIAGVLALPAVLLGVFSLARRGTREEHVPINNAALAERIEPGLQTRKLRHEREAAQLFGEDQTSPPPAASTQGMQPIEENDAPAPAQSATSTQADHDQVTRIAEKPAPAEANMADSDDTAWAAEHPAETTAQELGNWQSAFGPWLSRKPADEQLSHCIEFLIYWVAYGDDRYEPDLKKKLFTAVDLNDHDHIKRWVLKQDVFAFADVVSWLKDNASKAQLEQTINLIMALLVTERSVTPVQNTLLRFFADAFGLGKDHLEQSFEAAFAHPLPPMPRTDKVAWWNKQSDNEIIRWDSRKIAELPTKPQMLARLGFTAPQNEIEVIKSFRRAARRCHPDRFTQLGERERALAERRFSKFEEARDRLLGVSV